MSTENQVSPVKILTPAKRQPGLKSLFFSFALAGLMIGAGRTVTAAWIAAVTVRIPGSQHDKHRKANQNEIINWLYISFLLIYAKIKPTW
ncbi:MAG: hypothetical protein LKJ45_03415 [Oscillospiraceae bacterium]|jgi:hypothetical protein|nr:hypothetical protein [Oscillospiraceae bacterium]